MSIEEITQLEQSAAFARERDEKMKTISKSITEVAQIFKELAVLVIDQGTVLDRIDYNMEHTSERLQTATTQLVVANRSQSNARPLKYSIILLLVIVVLLILLIQKIT
mmetsp:Transcript_8022/g.27467  ORF Transcript_8022/g.27467 Transcript_8022/m.27467 type:complete len:108 (-) Transcript_8022:1013-1336(-)